MTHGAIVVAGLCASAIHAQEAAGDDAPIRWRVAIGPQLEPRYPGASGLRVGPYFDVSRARGDDPFAFEAPDESGGFPLWSGDGLSVGPTFSIQRGRNSDDLAVTLPRVGTTVELGGFVQYALRDDVRLRGEMRQGIGGHKGLIGMISADYVMRDADRWLIAFGPRLTLSNERYQRAFFTVAPETAAANSGLPAFESDGGVQAVGASGSFLRQLSPRWGIVGYAKYDRLVADPARSPLVLDYGNRNQFSFGTALSYSFGG